MTCAIATVCAKAQALKNAKHTKTLQISPLNLIRDS